MACQAAIHFKGFAVFAAGDTQGCWSHWFPANWILDAVQSHQAQGLLHLLRPLLMGGLYKVLETGEIAKLGLLKMGRLCR